MSDSDTLILETTQGAVTVTMRPDLAPQHVTRIKELVRDKFYDGVVFHRVIDGFMAQTGCPKGTGTGGSKYPNIPAEFNEWLFLSSVLWRAIRGRKEINMDGQD